MSVYLCTLDKYRKKNEEKVCVYVCVYVFGMLGLFGLDCATVFFVLNLGITTTCTLSYYSALITYA